MEGSQVAGDAPKPANGPGQRRGKRAIEKQTATKDETQVVVKGEKDELSLFTGCSLWRCNIDMAPTVLLTGVGAIPPGQRDPG